MDEWIKYQNENAKKILLQDSFDVNKIKYIGGVDISFNKNDPSLACGYLTIVNFDSYDIVYEDHQNITLSIPYFFIISNVLISSANSLINSYDSIVFINLYLFASSFNIDPTFKYNPYNFFL